MKNECIKIYVNVSAEEKETVFSGIKFNDFIECVPVPIENILLPSAVFVSEKYFQKFELFEGKGEIAKLLRKNIRNLGDFCFVDYADPTLVSSLSDMQVAELLYLVHMFKPLKSPFFENLQNKFAYLSHDDGWYCKLYCEEWETSVSILVNKVQRSIQKAFHNNECVLPHDAIEFIRKLSHAGLLVDLDFSMQKRNICTLKLYEVGKCENIDKLFNTIAHEKPPVSFETSLTLT